MSANMSINEAKEKWSNQFRRVYYHDRLNSPIGKINARIICNDLLKEDDLHLFYQVKCHLMLGGLYSDAFQARDHLKTAERLCRDLWQSRQNGEDDEILAYRRIIKESMEDLKPDLFQTKVDEEMYDSDSDSEVADDDDAFYGIQSTKSPKVKASKLDVSNSQDDEHKDKEPSKVQPQTAGREDKSTEEKEPKQTELTDSSESYARSSDTTATDKITISNRKTNSISLEIQKANTEESEGTLVKNIKSLVIETNSGTWIHKSINDI